MTYVDDNFGGKGKERALQNLISQPGFMKFVQHLVNSREDGAEAFAKEFGELLKNPKLSSSLSFFPSRCPSPAATEESSIEAVKCGMSNVGK